MPEKKKLTTPVRPDKPVLRLSRAKSYGKTRTSSKPNLKFNAETDKKDRPKRKGLTRGQKHNKPDAKKPAPTNLLSRKITYNILVAVDEGIHLDKALAANQALPKLDDRDRRFVRLLVTTSLRYRGQLEKVLIPLVARRPFGAQVNANLILLMGAAQLLLLKTGAHAAVNSTVELMRQTGFDQLCGLANAVMRRLTREGEGLLAATNTLDNLPIWLQQSWRHYWGDAVTMAIADLAMLPPPLDISVKGDATVWAEKLEAKHIGGNSLRREFDGDPSLLEGFDEGAWWVQDVAAALPAKLLNVTAGQTVIDLCAAPGGKTAQLITAGGTITAIDSNRKRLDRLHRNLERLRLSASLVFGDGRDYRPNAPVDAVLVDAPCSATGTIRRRPDILIKRDVEDISALQKLQWELATNALGWLRAGGRMVYATCSLQPEEGEDIISAIIDGADGQYAIDPITPDQADIFARSITDNGCLRILPSDYGDIGGVDGFFIARLLSLG